MKYIITDTILWGVITGMAVFVGMSAANADSTKTIILEENYYALEETNVTESNGAALAIATSQLNFDWSTEKWQAGLGVGSYANNDAISFGLGKRLGKTLINISIGRESNKYGYGAGVNWRF